MFGDGRVILRFFIIRGAAGAIIDGEVTSLDAWGRGLGGDGCTDDEIPEHRNCVKSSKALTETSGNVALWVLKEDDENDDGHNAGHATGLERDRRETIDLSGPELDFRLSRAEAVDQETADGAVKHGRQDEPNNDGDLEVSTVVKAGGKDDHDGSSEGSSERSDHKEEHGKTGEKVSGQALVAEDQEALDNGGNDTSANKVQRNLPFLLGKIFDVAPVSYRVAINTKVVGDGAERVE